MSIESKLSKLGKILDSILIGVTKSLKTLFADSLRNSSGENKRYQRNITPPYAVLVFDSFLAFLSIFVSIHLRIGMDFLDYSPMYIVKNMFVFGLVSASVFLWTHTYQPFWRYISIEDMPPLFLSAVLSNLIFFPLMLLMNQEDFLPYSVLVINVFALTFILTIPRFLVRMLYNRKKNKLKKIEGLVKIAGSQIENPEVLLVGNSLSAEAFLRDVVLNDDIQFNFEPVGILTLDPQDVGHVIRGVPIIAELRNIHLVLKDLTREGIRPRQIVITEKTLPENAKNFLIRYVKEHKLLLMHIIHQCMFDTVSE
ncbi:MAG: hypothetical protein LBM19_00035 [Holosporales bacterium]|nr:hypothetical protein [Holosporales bacterium]